MLRTGALALAVICGLLIFSGIMPIWNRKDTLSGRKGVDLIATKLTFAESQDDPEHPYRFDFIPSDKSKKSSLDFKKLNGSSEAKEDLLTRLRYGHMQHKGYLAEGSTSDVLLPTPLGIWKYFMVLVPLPLLAACGYVLLTMHEDQHRRIDMPAPSATLYDVSPKLPVWYRAMVYAILTAVWNGIAIPACLDYILHEPATTKIGGVVLLVVYGVVGLLLLGFTLNYLLNDLRVKKAEVKVSRLPLAIGQLVDVQTEQIFSRSVRLAAVRLGLVCSKIEAQKYNVAGFKFNLGFKKTPLAEIWREVLVSKQVKGGQSLTLDHNFTVPTDGRSTTRPEIEKGPWHVWDICLHLTFVDGPDYYRDFPVLAGHDKTAKQGPKVPKRPGQAAPPPPPPTAQK